MLPGSIEDICRLAQATYASVFHPMPPEACNMAQRLYAVCVDFCQKADLPLSSIRVTLYAWGGLPHKPAKRRTEHATELHFDGRGWSAQVVPHQRRLNPIASGWGDLYLETRPAKLFRTTKTRNEEVYRIRVVTWRAAELPYEEESFGVFDPWLQPLTSPTQRPLVRLTDEEGGTRDLIRITFLPNGANDDDTVEIFMGTDESTGWSALLTPGEDIVFTDTGLVLYGRFPHRGRSATVLVDEEYKGSIMSTHVDTLFGYEDNLPSWTQQPRRV
jgi:hypothetical protein